MGCTHVSTGYFILYGQFFFFFPKRFNGCEDLSFTSTRHIQKKRIVRTVGIGSELKGFDQKNVLWSEIETLNNGDYL